MNEKEIRTLGCVQFRVLYQYFKLLSYIYIEEFFFDITIIFFVLQMNFIKRNYGF